MPELEDELMVFTEDETLDPGYWAWTDRWVKDCWGETSTKLMHGEPVLNSGSIMGTKQGVGALAASHDACARIIILMCSVVVDLVPVRHKKWARDTAVLEVSVCPLPS
jgi:hypothetical protein